MKKDSSLILVRGHYFDTAWGEQPHWWCKDKNGNIVDPTKDQFPSRGTGIYTEFDGMVSCETCGVEIEEQQALYYGNYAFCSGLCIYKCVMPC